MSTAKNTTRPACPCCQVPGIRWGKDRAGHQRFRCGSCRKTWADRPARPLGSMRLPLDRAILCLKLLVEGNSIRGTERITGTHRDTVCKLLRLVGDRCADLLENLIQGVEVGDIQADEIWTYVGMKEKTKAKNKIRDPQLGDAYTFVGIERDSKLVLAWELGRRTIQSTDSFVEKLDKATAGQFQLTTDGFAAYPESINYHLGMRTDYAVLIKEYGSEGPEEMRRYSPPRIIATTKTPVHGNPDEARICTSHVERQNLTMRTHMKRLNRLTCAFSKKWENLRAALGLHFAFYNLCRFHRSLRMTPAMKAGVTRAPWSMEDLVRA